MLLRRRHTSTTSDEDLVAHLCNGDPLALGLLWDRYAHLVLVRYLKDAERGKDAVVQLFTDLPELVQRHRVERFRPWLHTVMRNRCLLALRNERPQVAVKEVPLRGVDPGEEEQQNLHEADLQRLKAAFTMLNEAQRSCVTLFHLERLSYQEVSERTGHSVEQVRSHLQNGRRNLRLILERHATGYAH